ncbi:MAG: ATP-binding protein [Thermoanaerobaculia bacterium]
MIDVRTLLFANAIVFALLAVAMIVVWRANPRFPGLASLARVHVSMMVGVALIGLPAGRVPAVVSMVAGNGLVLLSTAWLLNGIRGLFGLPPARWPRIAFPLWLATLLFFIYAQPSLRGRILASALAALTCLCAAAWTSLAGVRGREDRASSLLIFGSLGLLSAVFTVRCIAVAIPTHRAQPVSSDLPTIALVTASLMAATGWTLGVMNLVYARLNGEARRSRAEIARREAISRALLDSIPDMMFRVTPEGTILDGPAGEPLPPEAGARLREGVRRSLETGGPVTFEYRVPAGDGTERAWEGRVNPTPLAEFLVLSRDVTERERYEAGLEQLVQVAAHELRSPLTSVLSTLRWLTAPAAALSAEERERLLDVARRNGERMLRLVDDLLDLDRLEAGQASFQIERVEIDRLLPQARELSEGLARQLGVDVELQPLPGAKVRADPQQLLRVLVNLLSNALRFSPPGESVRLSVSRTEDAVRVEVRDRGPGIPSDLRTRIFQRFARGAPPEHAETEGKGSGLGLAISKALIEGMGGRIGFETAELAGTTFYFELPAEPG